MQQPLPINHNLGRILSVPKQLDLQRLVGELERVSHSGREVRDVARIGSSVDVERMSGKSSFNQSPFGSFVVTLFQTSYFVESNSSDPISDDVDLELELCFRVEGGSYAEDDRGGRLGGLVERLESSGTEDGVRRDPG